MATFEDLPTLMFSPNASWYAVIRMDPVATVRHLNDPVATAAAEALSPKKYLVYLEHELEFPWPDKPWYPYTISALGPSLRDEDATQGFTPDMCLPVYPNSTHPSGREPLRPRKPFPYNNCYHWIAMEMDIRVLARPEEHFDLRLATTLPPREQLRMNHQWTDDHCRRKEMAPICYDAAIHPADPTSPPSLTDERDPAQDSHTTLDPCPDSESLAHSCSSRSCISGESDVDSVEAIWHVFGNSQTGQDLTLLPLFELWEDVGAHLTEDEISNPTGLFEERDAMIRIVQDARVRAYAALTADNPASARGIHQDRAAATRSDRGLDGKGIFSGPRWRRMRPTKVVQKLRSLFQRIAALL